MSEAEIKFEREGRDGLIPVGTYLSNAAGRFGIRFKEQCDPGNGLHHCEVEVTGGGDLLSDPTAGETKYFEEHGPRGDRRLACQAKIEKAGGITVITMAEETSETSQEANAEKKADDFRKEFAEMPLERKIANLVQLEAMAFSETVSFVINSPYMVFDKVLDVLAEFGFRKEANERSAGRPREHTETSGNDEAKVEVGAEGDKVDEATGPQA